MSELSIRSPTPGETLAIGIVFPIVCGSVVALRFYSRYESRASYRLDDWVSVPALLLLLGMGICTIIGVENKALAFITPPSEPSQGGSRRKVQYTLRLLSLLAVSCVRLDLVFLYKRTLCSNKSPVLKTLFWILAGICVAWGLAFAFGLVALWSTGKRWYEVPGYLYTVEITSLALNASLLLMPVLLMPRLHLSLIRKFALAIALCLGASALGSSVVRLVIFVRAVRLSRYGVHSGLNESFVTAELYWATFEVGIGLLAACLPSCYSILTAPLEPIYSWIRRDTPGYEDGKRASGSTLDLVPGSTVNCMDSVATDGYRRSETPILASISTSVTQDRQNRTGAHLSRLDNMGIIITSSFEQNDSFLGQVEEEDFSEKLESSDKEIGDDA